jgi:release factor glutamine methyltransferase
MDVLTERLRGAGCVFAEAEAEVLRSAAGSPEQLEEFVAARLRGVPLEHVVGYADFGGVRIALDAGVFVPRQRSRLLVDAAVDLLRPGDTLVDLCCGSGAIGVAIAETVSGLAINAVDIDPVAVACAARNLGRYGGRTYLGDLFDPLPAGLAGQIAVVVANAPYVPTDDVALMPREARDHEPRHALDGGPDGVAMHRRIAAAAPGWLRPGGALLIETSVRQAAATSKACRDGGLSPRTLRDEELGATVVVASKPRVRPRTSRQG